MPNKSDIVIKNDDNNNPKKYVLPEMSDEQKRIIKYIKDHNVIVDSVAGSGKTTTVLHIAKKYTNNKILLLTYNKRLKEETRTKIVQLKLENIIAENYHSFCKNKYNKPCYRDEMIRDIINSETNVKFNYDIIIIDEAQDVTPLYYNLICKIYKDLKRKPRFCIIGDKYQSIFGFNGSDSRYIQLADKILNFTSKYKWKKLYLSQTFRLTKQMCDFVNKCVLNENRLKSNKEGCKVNYIMHDAFDDNKNNCILKLVLKELKVYKPEDIFILAFSVKKGSQINSIGVGSSRDSPVKRLENALVKNKILIHVTSNDDEKIDLDIIKQKLVICTFHQAKGLERKCIIMFGFDAGHFVYYERDKNISHDVCSNILYVAITRAIEKLYILHHYRNDYFSFVNRNKVRDVTNFIEYSNFRYQNPNKLNETPLKIEDLIKHLPFEVIEKAETYFTKKCTNEKGNKINILSKTKQGNTFEAVSDINGVAIPAYYEFQNTGNMTIYNEIECETVFEKIETYDVNSDSDNDSIIGKIMAKKSVEFKKPVLTLKMLTPSVLLKISNEYCSFRSGYIHKLRQISKYDWLDQNSLDRCIKRLRQHISKTAKYEKIIKEEIMYNYNTRKIVGCIDCIDNNKVFEFKCVNELLPEHFIQLAIYAYIYEKKLERTVSNQSDNTNTKSKYFPNLSFGMNKFGPKHNISGTESEFTTVNPKLANTTVIKNKYYLFNILTNEIYKIKFKLNDLLEMIKYLIKSKEESKKITDLEFVKNCKDISDKIIGYSDNKSNK